MAGVQIIFDSGGLGEYYDQLIGLDTRPLMDEIGAYMIEEIYGHFSDSEQWDGQPLTPSQRALAEGGTTLDDHGILKGSYTYIVGPDGEDVVIGSNMVYAAIHHFGGKAGRNHSVTLPPRPVLGINADDEQDILAIAQDFIQGQAA